MRESAQPVTAASNTAKGQGFVAAKRGAVASSDRTRPGLSLAMHTHEATGGGGKALPGPSTKTGVCAPSGDPACVQSLSWGLLSLGGVLSSEQEGGGGDRALFWEPPPPSLRWCRVC